MSRDQYKIDASRNTSALGKLDIGMIIYTADMSIIKRKGLNGAWIPMSILH